MALPWTNAWITGASSGIGRELALNLARGGVRVAVSARSADRLAALSAEDARIIPVPLDVTDREAVADAHRHIEAALGPLDLAVLNAGVWHPMRCDAYDPALALTSMQVNYFGVTHALAPLIPAMVGRGRGQIALVASVAGYRGLPMAAAYAPSKAAVISLAEVLRLELAGKGLTINLVNPGFVDTPMTEVNTFSMPHMIKADDAARRIVIGLERGLAGGRFEIAFPWPLILQLKLLRLAPDWLYRRIAERMVVD